MEKQLTQGAKRILDESDENACGFCVFYILDQDGYAKKTKGSAVEVPWYLSSSAGDDIVLEAELPANPLFFLQVSSEEGNYFWGQWWLGDAKRTKTNAICDLVPKDCKAIQKTLDGDVTEFEVEAQMPFIKGSSSKLVKIKLTTKEQKFVTKVTSAKLTVPKALWTEWKEYRLRLWRSGKVWGGEDKDDEKENDEKKDEKKDEEKPANKATE
ncbi:unnamed protein product [Polarella glacialis]|uniref:Uncharacterized protein n=1 Tax=Polarella glacialis TaxID=89957 RepID=A0A813L059_POLGL|nr:unnamed protein product [Polarella glacialis]